MDKPVINAVVETLIDCGVEYTFGVPGGGTLFLYDALCLHKDKITSILARHEGAAACMADAYGRLSGKPAAVIAQGAWMASNAAFGILEAFMAGSPMIVITDTSDYGGFSQYGPWQNGTGEYGGFDLVTILRSMSKYTTYANTPGELVHGIRLAARHAVTGRPGPACVVARMNLFGMAVDMDTQSPKLLPLNGAVDVFTPSLDDTGAAAIARALVEAKDPVAVAGTGVHIAKAHDELRRLAELLGMPVATSYMGKSALAETHPLSLGTMGAIGQKAANKKIQEADVILAVGTGLSPENTKMLSSEFINPERQTVIHLDIEPRNIGWTFRAAMGAVCDAKKGLAQIIKAVETEKRRFSAEERIKAIEKIKAETGFFHCEEFGSNESPIAPERIVKAVENVSDENTLLCLDAGNNRQWFARHFRSKAAGQVLAPGGVGGVGWGVPAALGAQMTQPHKKAIGVSGDGGMMMMLHCLESAAQYGAAVTWVVLNNSVLGNIRDFQNPERRYCTEYPSPNFQAYARAAGCDTYRVESPSALEDVLSAALNGGKPSLVEVITKAEPHFKLMM